MYFTETEIMSTHEALEKTYMQIVSMRSEIESFFSSNSQRRVVFIGCGSSFMIAKGCARLFATKPDTSTIAIASGDYLVNPDYYKDVIRESVVIGFSRTGATSEILRAVDHMRETSNARIVSLTLSAENAFADRSNLSIKLPWAYDESVCQTRSVTNLFAAYLLLYAICYGDDQLIADVGSAIETNEQFKIDNRPALEAIGKKDFTDVVVLADGPLDGIAEEGALAFTEITFVPGRFSHVLDYRHGPIVLNGKNTLTIVALQTGEDTYQSQLIADLKTRGGLVVTVGQSARNPYNADLHIDAGHDGSFAAMGIPFIYVCQMIAFAHALQKGVNPDKPSGLDLFITLK